MDYREYTIEDLEELLDSIPYAVWLKDTNGKYKYVNKYFSEKIGYRKEDIISKCDKEIMIGCVCKESNRFVGKTRKSLELEVENAKDNKKSYFNVIRTLLNKKKKLTGGIAEEVSNEKNIKSAAIENLMTIIDNGGERKYYESDSKILNDLKETMKCDDIALYLLDEDSEIMNLYIHEGCSYEKYSGGLAKEFYTSLNLESNDKTIIKSDNDETAEYLYSIRIKDKLYGMISLNYKQGTSENMDDWIIKHMCEFFGVIIDTRNISKHLSEQLRKKKDVQKRLEMVIDTEIDVYAIIEVNKNNFKWICINKTFENLTGINCSILGEKPPIEYIHPDDKEYFQSVVNNSKGICRNLICRVVCKDGKYRTMRLNWSMISDNTCIVTGKDITNEQKLLKDKENLQRAIEIESLKTEFFANISHEFKTPLNIILSTVQVISSYINNNMKNFSQEKFRKYIKGIRQNSYRLLKLANNMIDLSKIDGGFYELDIDNYNIVEIVENIVQSVAMYMKNNKRIILFDTMEEEIITSCDPEKIERIILNLLSNSMKFTSENGCIEVIMDVTDDCRDVIIKVRNDGPPVSREDAEKIFNRFTQSENLLTRSVEGSGIGLSLVKSLVELHQGKIYVNTEFKNGTEFCIELPIRKIMNSKTSHVSNKKLNSKVEKFTMEFSDIYNLNE